MEEDRILFVFAFELMPNNKNNGWALFTVNILFTVNLKAGLEVACNSNDYTVIVATIQSI